MSVPGSHPVVEGRLDGLVDGYVLGWAWSPESPTERIWVALFVDDEPVGLIEGLDVGFGEHLASLITRVAERYVLIDGRRYRVRPTPPPTGSSSTSPQPLTTPPPSTSAWTRAPSALSSQGSGAGPSRSAC
jgi:hypothetical protein